MPHLRIAVDPIAPIDRSMSPAEVADILGIDPSTVRKMAKKGLLRWHHVGSGTRDIRIFLSSVEEYREARTGRAPDDETVSPPRKLRSRKSTASYNEAFAFMRKMGLV